MSNSPKRSPSIEVIYSSKKDSIDRHHRHGSSRSRRSCSRDRSHRNSSRAKNQRSLSKGRTHRSRSKGRSHRSRSKGRSRRSCSRRRSYRSRSKERKQRRSLSREKIHKSHSRERSHRICSRSSRHDDQKDISSSYGRPVPPIPKQTTLPHTLPDQLWTEELRELRRMKIFHYRYFRKHESAEHEVLYKIVRGKLRYAMKQTIQQWMNGLNNDSKIGILNQQAAIREKRKICIEERNRQKQQQRELEGWVTVESKPMQPQETFKSELETPLKSYDLPYREIIPGKKIINKYTLKSKGFQTLRDKGEKSETESELSNFSSIMEMLVNIVHEEESNNGNVYDGTSNKPTTDGDIQTLNYAVQYSGSATDNSQRHEVSNNKQQNISQSASNFDPEKRTMANDYNQSCPVSQNSESKLNFKPEGQTTGSDYNQTYSASQNNESTYNFDPQRQKMANNFNQSWPVLQNMASASNSEMKKLPMDSDYNRSWRVSQNMATASNYETKPTMANDHNQSWRMSQNVATASNFETKPMMANDYNQSWRLSQNVATPSNFEPNKLTTASAYNQSWPVAQNRASASNFETKKSTMDSDYNQSLPVSQNMATASNFETKKSPMDSDYNQSWRMSQNVATASNFEPNKLTMANDYNQSWPVSQNMATASNFETKKSPMDSDYNQSWRVSQNMATAAANFEHKKPTMANDNIQVWALSPNNIEHEKLPTNNNQIWPVSENSCEENLFSNEIHGSINNNKRLNGTNNEVSLNHSECKGNQSSITSAPLDGVTSSSQKTVGASKGYIHKMRNYL